MLSIERFLDDGLGHQIDLIEYLHSRGHSPIGWDDDANIQYYYCPVPDHDDRAGTFEVNEANNRFRCPKCAIEGGVVQLAAVLDGVTEDQAAERLLKEAQAPAPAHRPRRPYDSETSIVDLLAKRGHTPAAINEGQREVTFRCPFTDHEDRTPSFSVNTERNVWHCFGCDRGGNAADLIQQLDEGQRPTVGACGSAPLASADSKHGLGTVDDAGEYSNGCSLEQIAATKRIPVNFLQSCGWEDFHYLGKRAVRILYFDTNSQEAAARFRVALTGDRFRWRSGSKPMPYGLSRLTEARERGFVLLVEGETDTVTLWLHGLPALGVPGASTWRSEWSRALDGVETIYVVVEPDQGGTTLLSRLARSPLCDRVRVIRMTPAAKDMNNLHLLDAEGFVERVERLQTEAKRLADEQSTPHEEREIAAEKAWTHCAELANKPDILAEFMEAAQRQGVVGESRALQTLYLVVTSRLLDRPVSAVVKAPSGTGKSLLVEHVIGHFPDDAYVNLTAASPKALLYAGVELSHRTLVYAEAAGVAEGFGAYLVRSLVSEGRVKHLTVDSSEDGMVGRTLEVEGPIALVLTTIRANLDEELETRLLNVPGDDSPEQTKQVMMAAARRRSGPRPDMEDPRRIWRELQTWLAGANHVVEIPFAEAIVELTPPTAVALRRGVNMLLSLVESHALLHQATRDRSASGNILATYEDYAKVRELVGELIARRNASVVAPQVRNVVKAVVYLTRLRAVDEREGVSVQAVAAYLGLDQASVKLHVSDALALGYLRNVARLHQTRQLRAGDPIPDDTILFPTLEQVRARAESDERPLPPLLGEEETTVPGFEQNVIESGYTLEEFGEILDLLAIEQSKQIDTTVFDMHSYTYINEHYVEN